LKGHMNSIVKMFEATASPSENISVFFTLN
jgi:hypothetical protein